MSGRFTGKVALVTGGGSGIGSATCLAFAREGAKVAVADISTEGGDETVHAIQELGGEAIFVKTDVTKSQEVEALMLKASETFGSIDYCFNNAGTMGRAGSVTESPEEVYDRTMAINAKGVWLCMKYEIPMMLQKGQGAIVNTASIAGIGGTPDNLAYGASKAAVIHMTRTAALEFAKSGIRVNVVCPGFTRTKMVGQLVTGNVFTEAEMDAMHPIGRIGEPDEVAEVVLWLCSDASSFVTGHALFVDGGYTARCL